MKRVLLAAVLCLLPALSQAQTLNVQFTASADHNATAGTTPIVSSYALQVLDSTQAIIRNVSLGKPTPDSANIVHASAAITPALNPGVYSVRAIAVGPGGNSTPSNAAPYEIAMPRPSGPTNFVITVTVALNDAGDPVLLGAEIAAQ